MYLASGPLDVERRELGVVARPVRPEAGTAGGLETGPLGAAAVRRLRLGGRRIGRADKGVQRCPESMYACCGARAVRPGRLRSRRAAAEHDAGHRATAAAASANGWSPPGRRRRPQPRWCRRHRRASGRSSGNRVIGCSTATAGSGSPGNTCRHRLAQTTWVPGRWAQQPAGGWVWLEGHWA